MPTDVQTMTQTDQHSPGAKLDDGKPDMSLLMDFSRALEQVALVGTYGKVKYSRGGWQFVSDGINRYLSAAWRHLTKVFTGKKFDEDPFYETPTGLPYRDRIRHDAQVAWNFLAWLELRLREEESQANRESGIFKQEYECQFPSLQEPEPQNIAIAHRIEEILQRGTSGCYLEAIREYRGITGASLKQTKHYVDVLKAEMVSV